jgi:hypothetical protein
MVKRAAEWYTPPTDPMTVFQQHSAALYEGKCPVCHAKVDTEIDKKDQMVYFKCQRNPVFHEWRRTQSFLTRD